MFPHGVLGTKSFHIGSQIPATKYSECSYVHRTGKMMSVHAVSSNQKQPSDGCSQFHMFRSRQQRPVRGCSKPTGTLLMRENRVSFYFFLLIYEAASLIMAFSCMLDFS